MGALWDPWDHREQAKPAWWSVLGEQHLSPPSSRALWETALGWDCLTEAPRNPLSTLPDGPGVTLEYRGLGEVGTVSWDTCQEPQGTSFAVRPSTQGGPPPGSAFLGQMQTEAPNSTEPPHQAAKGVGLI